MHDLIYRLKKKDAWRARGRRRSAIGTSFPGRISETVGCIDSNNLIYFSFVFFQKPSTSMPVSLPTCWIRLVAISVWRLWSFVWTSQLMHGKEHPQSCWETQREKKKEKKPNVSSIFAEENWAPNIIVFPQLSLSKLEKVAYTTATVSVHWRQVCCINHSFAIGSSRDYLSLYNSLDQVI